jgi:hypothetical protein
MIHLRSVRSWRDSLRSWNEAAIRRFRLHQLHLRRRRTQIRRQLLWTVPLFVLLSLLLAWVRPRPIASSGGLYFFRRVALPVPVFAQGDPRWKDDLLGPTEATLHAEGCAVSAAAMVMASYGIDTDPGRLNRFLTENGGYTPEGWIYWEKAAELCPGTVEKAYEDAPTYARIDSNLLSGNPVIVRIRLPQTNHFVVIAGKQGWDYLICDPGGGASRGLYPLKEIAPRIEALRYYRKLR